MTDLGSIGERLETWNRKGDPADLWPGMRFEHYSAAVARLVRLTADVLAEREPGRLTIPHGSTRRALGIAGLATGVGPLVGYWIERGTVRADDEVANLFAEHLEHGRKRAALLSSELEHLLRQLEKHQVPVTVLKGSHLGRDYYPEPGTRVSSDIDLLVHPGQAARAEAVLTHLGFVSATPVWPPHRADWRLPGQGGPRSLELTHAENPWSVDLHSSLDRKLIQPLVGSFGELKSHDRIRWSESHPGAYSMAPPALLSFLAFHASAGFDRVRLILVVDMVFVIRRYLVAHPGGWSDLERDIWVRDIPRYVYPALSLVDKLVPGIVNRGTIARLKAATPRRIRRRVGMATLLTTNRLEHVGLSTRLMWVTSIKEALRFAGRMVWPRRQHLTRWQVYHARLRALRHSLRRRDRSIRPQNSAGSEGPE
jgi:hypothetical protein